MSPEDRHALMGLLVFVFDLIRERDELTERVRVLEAARRNGDTLRPSSATRTPTFSTPP